MRQSLRLLAVITLGGFVSACATHTAEISKMNVMGGDYEKGLHKGYLKLAESEFAEHDWSDGKKFEQRARMAALGNPTAPEKLSAREIPKEHKKPLGDAYMRLTAAMAEGGALDYLPGYECSQPRRIRFHGRNASAGDGLLRGPNRAGD